MVSKNSCDQHAIFVMKFLILKSQIQQMETLSAEKKLVTSSSGKQLNVRNAIVILVFLYC